MSLSSCLNSNSIFVILTELNTLQSKWRMNFRVHLKIHIIIMWLFRAPSQESRESRLESQNFLNVPNFFSKYHFEKTLFHHKLNMHDADEAL